MEPAIELARFTRPRMKSMTTSRSAITSPQQTHHEQHSLSGDVIRDMIIGFADGLTVPFALTAGLSSLGSSKLVITGGLAELFSGAISMGLGAYLAAVTDRDHYNSEEKREREEILTKAEAEKQEIVEILDEYGISKEASALVVRDLCRDHEAWIKFMMAFELKLENPNVSRAWISAATMGASYFIGGLIPMIPYFSMTNVTHALFVSIGITFVILLLFGFVKSYITVRTKQAGVFGALQTLFIGALAAGTSYGIVRGINSSSIAGGI